jgi:hypothetical protein
MIETAVPALRLVVSEIRHEAVVEADVMMRSANASPQAVPESTLTPRVRLTFVACRSCSFRSAHSNTQVISDSAFDWTQVPFNDLLSTDLEAFQAQFDAAWESSGNCPDPRVYEVRLLGNGTAEPGTGERQYLVLGHDGYIDIVGELRGWEFVRQ